jgi:4-hydroxy-2-oxoheptanedioate aldolase
MRERDRPSPEQPWCGAFSTFADAFSVELLGTIGFDYLCIDLQHGLSDEATLRHCLMALNGSATVPLVRPLANDVAVIGRVLDLGARGVIVPMVETPEQAAQAIAACRYAPAGRRSFGPLRHSLRAPVDAATAQPLCLVMIETALGLTNVEAIAATPGLDGIYIGPTDLALSLGVPLAEIGTSPAHVAAVAAIRTAAVAHGLIAGMHCLDGPSARRARESGFTMVTAATDSIILRSGAAAALTIGRS